MSDNVLINGTMMGVAGAGAGYLVGMHQTADITARAAKITAETNLLKQPIIDEFAKHGYKEGMNISQAAFDKVQEFIKKG